MQMKTVAKIVMAAMLTAAPMAMPARSAVAQSAPAADAPLTTLTVHEAWVQSGRNEDKFFDMVKQLAEMSAQKRGVTLKDSEDTGKKMGLLIKASARRDPDQLLYAVVDAAVKKTAATTATAAK
jgi:hypothetical protein